VVDGMIVSNVSVPSGIFNVTKSNLGGNHSIMQDSWSTAWPTSTPRTSRASRCSRAPPRRHLRREGQQRRVIINTKRGQAGLPRGRDAAVRRLRGFEHDRRPHLRIVNEVISQFCPRTRPRGSESTCVANQTAYFGPGTVYDHDKELAGRHDLGPRRSSA